ncbi:hypothetical protein IFT37_07355 [Pseudomonas fluorescens]|uniref:Uncharacterized protein n=1 Tax=Pseudomonas fluorescens TaxID=294 RepID=A0AAE2Q4G8_PSEFL|nr:MULTISPECIES: hypothetical protein [Pseudomonas fluorescens group]MBA1430649.1 hypothetical protein [Pseudomonas orientalis]MBD8150221.1 hypothetical protein [Pseudomonas fluorescens]MBD8176030.1 hypothetical protein [Pseudomonas fluorescens]MBD8273359.1 hypothetical protein [Pseudomonas fluorescens]MBD8744916.1 hypothetical protein [Pseudomonas fluorescens]
MRNFVVGVLGLAALLGFYFVQLNAEADRQREATAEQLALCLHLKRVAGATASTQVELGEACRQLNMEFLNSVKVE